MKKIVVGTRELKSLFNTNITHNKKFETNMKY